MIKLIEQTHKPCTHFKSKYISSSFKKKILKIWIIILLLLNLKQEILILLLFFIYEIVPLLLFKNISLSKCLECFKKYINDDDDDDDNDVCNLLWNFSKINLTYLKKKG